MNYLNKVLVVLILVTVWSCSTIGKRGVASDATSARIETLQRMVEEAMIWRSEAVKLVGSLDEKTRNKQVLSGHDIDQLLNTMEFYADFYQRMTEEIKADKIFFEEMSQETRKIDVNSADGQEYFYHLKRLAAGQMVIYDNYLYVVYPLNKNTKLRRLVNWDNERVTSKLSAISNDINGQEGRELLARVLDTNKKEQKVREKKSLNYSSELMSEFVYLDTVVDQSMTVNYLQHTGTRVADDFGGLFRALRDVFHEAGSFITYIGSKLFGNVVGTVEMRKGKLITMPQAEQDEVISKLEPLDILLERTPFRLTSKFIPGYFGHVAIWTGNEQQLRDLGVWDHPSVVPYQKAVQEGSRIIEALRSGVEYNTFQHFLNIDDLVAMRIKNPLTPEQKKRYLIMAFEQLGKAYDFNFDVETEDRIVCSELAYVVYQDTDWPTARMIGRATISPDNVASEAFEGRPFEPVLIYRDGTRLAENLTAQLFDMLDTDKKKAPEKELEPYRPVGRDR